ncbi:hypothetical protein C2869_10315 [Saccharobesus litoralis]|uniref:DUF4397 domain-containing protein n=1 Tax=Saccharobesus litoralis TaxID=2172099 RepID=A0A2S0VRE9_9ALTE|nr:hypothetical protein [Saccharobesus litoralis]AWB66797.1 hypothetical protein C2869_10315 [Saccharobesus litoralis]
MLKNFANSSCLTLLPTLVISALLSACSSSDEDANETGFVQFYNAATNSPNIYWQMNAVEEDDEDIILASSSYGDASSRYTYASGEFSADLLWLEDANSYATLNELNDTITADQTNLVVVAGNIDDPTFLSFNYQEDTPEEQIEFRFLPLTGQTLDLYISPSEKSFADADLIGTFVANNLSDSFNLDFDEYKFYITQAGANTVLFESSTTTFSIAKSYVFTVLPSNSPGQSPFLLQRIDSTSSTLTYRDINAAGEYKIFNGLADQQAVDLYIDNIDETPEISAIASNSFSTATELEVGDYSLNFKLANSDEFAVQNYLLTLNPNEDNTTFLYSVADTYWAITLDNNNQVSFYEHDIKFINLVEVINEDDIDEEDQIDEEFDVFYVKAGETIESTPYYLSNVDLAEMQRVILPNGDYNIFVTRGDADSRELLIKQAYTLDKNSGNQYLVLQQVNGEFQLTIDNQ